MVTGRAGKGTPLRRIVAGLLLLVSAAAASTAMAADVVKVFKAEDDKIRYAYHYELLDEVLKRTTAEYGPSVEQPYTEPISIARGHQEGVRGELLNLLISDAGHRILDEGMIPVPFPLDKGLLGYRVALIARWNQDRINQVNTLEQFRSLKVGQGSHWGDVPIYEYNQVPIQTSSTYEALFLMLLHGRFDLFPRGVTEVQQELASYGPRFPDLAIDQHLLIKYPFAQFFYVSKSEPRLARRLQDGLEQMAGDGSFDALFDKHFAKPLAGLKLGQRVVIELRNPFLPSWVPFGRPELWFRPETVKQIGPADPACAGGGPPPAC